MKILYQSVLGLLGNAMLARAQMGGSSPSPLDVLNLSFQTTLASKTVNDAIDNLIAGTEPQPTCVDPVTNRKSNFLKTTDYQLYRNQNLTIFDCLLCVSDVVCITVEDNIDDTTLAAHPFAPEALTLGSMQGTPDYLLGTGLAQAFISAAMTDGCPDTGGSGLAIYPWQDPTTQSPVSYDYRA